MKKLRILSNSYLHSRTNLLLLIAYLSLATIFGPLEMAFVNNCLSIEVEVYEPIIYAVDHSSCSSGGQISKSPVGAIPKSSGGWFLPKTLILPEAIFKKRLTKGERRRRRRRQERLREAKSELFDLMLHLLSQTFAIPSTITLFLILFCIGIGNVQFLFLALVPLFLWWSSILSIRYPILRQPESKLIKWLLQLIALSFILTAAGWFFLRAKQFLYLSYQQLFGNLSFVLAGAVVFETPKISLINIVDKEGEKVKATLNGHFELSLTDLDPFRQFCFTIFLESMGLLSNDSDKTINTITLQELSLVYGIKVELLTHWRTLWQQKKWPELWLDVISTDSKPAASDEKNCTFTSPSSNQELDYWQKARKIIRVVEHLKSTNFREIAKATGFSLTSVYRHMKARIARNQHPESHFWETQEGQEWLARLVTSTLFHFAIKRGIGLESLSNFFKTIQIDTHFGVSATALRGVQLQIEEQIVKYGKVHELEGANASSQLEIVGGVDETFFDQMVLVMLDLVSGYALCEEFSESRSTDTWIEKVDKALKPFPAKVRYLVSDRAKPLINLATKHFECSSIADLFHAVHKISQGFSLPLQRRLKNAEKEAKKAHEKLNKISEQETFIYLEQQACYQQAQEEVKKCQKTVEQYQGFLHQFTLTVHPFDITDSSPQSSSVVVKKLGEIVANLRQYGQEQQLISYQKHLKTVKNQLTDLGALMDVWFDWVDQSLAQQNHDEITKTWLKEVLLPKIYWQYQVKKCRSKKLRPIYQTAYQHSMLKFNEHPITKSVKPELMLQYEEWAKTMVNRFQRTSSAVEGRNGYLSQLNFCRRGLGKKKLPVLTVLHNFELRRQDGTTAAQRFFGQEFPDLFEWVLPNINKLPRPRKSRLKKTPTPTPSKV